VVGRDGSEGDKRKVPKCAAGNKFFGCLFRITDFITADISLSLVLFC